MADEKAKAITGEFVTVVGKQPVFSSSDRSECEAVAFQKKLDGIKAGVDFSSEEHKIRVGVVTFQDSSDKVGSIVF